MNYEGVYWTALATPGLLINTSTASQFPISVVQGTFSLIYMLSDFLFANYNFNQYISALGFIKCGELCGLVVRQP